MQNFKTWRIQLFKTVDIYKFPIQDYYINAMEQEQHPINLGKLLVNFQSLEFVLRAFLYESTKNTIQNASSHDKLKLDKLKEGDLVGENAFTNYDTLKKLIVKYNNNAKISSANFTIDETIVDVRDAITHGRVFGDIPEPPMTLLKFSEPSNKQVKVTFSVQMTKE
jgi:hypothetical protein